ncbi:MAG: hypothetical protein LUG85_08835 [Clostridiales bacterium]|nr:hypothetical protein [Clostridiales bacterium]
MSLLEGWDWCYCDCNGIAHITDQSHKLLPGFGEFAAEYYNCKDEIIPWYEIIRRNTKTDREAYDTFFGLYDKYLLLPDLKRDTFYLQINYLRYAGLIKTFSQLVNLIKPDFPWLFDTNIEAPQSTVFEGFSNFVKEQLDTKNDERLWSDVITDSGKTDLDNLDLFFSLFDRYCGELNM